MKTIPIMSEAEPCGGNVGVAVAELLRQQPAVPRPHSGHTGTAVALADLRKLTTLLRPIYGSVAHVLVNRAGVQAASRDALINGLAKEMSDTVLGDSFRVAARVALSRT